MTLTRDLLEAVETAFHLEGEGYTFDDLFTQDNRDTLAELYLVAEGYRKTAANVAKLVEAKLEPLLDRSVEVAGTLIWRGEKKTERCIDADGFWSWLSVQDDPELVRKVFNPNSARKGALPPAARDTFFEKQASGKVEVQSAPVEVLEDAKQKKKLREET